MICTLWTPFQAERDWKSSYREILLIPLYILFSMVTHFYFKDVKNRKIWIFHPHYWIFWDKYILTYRVDQKGREFYYDAKLKYKAIKIWLNENLFILCLLFYKRTKFIQLQRTMHVRTKIIVVLQVLFVVGN